MLLHIYSRNGVMATTRVSQKLALIVIWPLTFYLLHFKFIRNAVEYLSILYTTQVTLYVLYIKALDPFATFEPLHRVTLENRQFSCMPCFITSSELHFVFFSFQRLLQIRKKTAVNGGTIKGFKLKQSVITPYEEISRTQRVA